MGEHTPGPWTIEDPISGQMSIVEAGKKSHEWRFIANVDEGDLEDGFPQEVAEANARLIAAAPSMLEALKQVGPAMSSLMDELAKTRATNWGIVNQCACDVNAAIFLATRRAPETPEPSAEDRTI